VVLILYKVNVMNEYEDEILDLEFFEDDDDYDDAVEM
jgi:hypothetical protein